MLIVDCEAETWPREVEIWNIVMHGRLTTILVLTEQVVMLTDPPLGNRFILLFLLCESVFGSSHV